jgi:hypothetical protein
MNHQEAFQREVTAYHEAGHAVIAYVLGYKLKSVTIIPTHDAHGMVQYLDPLRGIPLDAEVSDRARLRLEKAIQISFAGPLAQRKFKEHAWRDYHGEFDFKKIGELGIRAVGSAEQQKAFLRWLEIATLEMVDAHWSAIERVAKLLLARDRLNGAEIIAALRSNNAAPIRITPRGRRNRPGTVSV